MSKNLLSKYSTRQSNIELLRIISMFAILFWHGIHHGFLQCDIIDGFGINILNLCHWACFWHVNVFLLISGYFGIKFRWKNVLNFLLYILFYYVLLLILIPIISNGNISLYSIIRAPYTFFHDFIGWWFVKPYMFLMLLSPILELARKVSNEKLISILVSLTILNIIVGFLFQGGFNNDGFCVEQFCYMYVIGIFIQRFKDKIQNKLSISKCLSLFMILTLVLFLVGKFSNWSSWYGYNNPLVIINSCLILLLFLRVKLQNNLCNTIAISTLAVYLLTDHNILTRPFIIKLTKCISELSNGNVFYILVSWFVICIIIFALCILFDMLLRVIMKYILRFLSKFTLNPSDCGI